MSLRCLRAWLFAVDRLLAPRDQRGQTTAEYALVIIGVAAVASLFVAWATKSHAITNLFDAVINRIKP